MASQTCTFDQLLYSWSAASIFGRRGFGVVAASPGWRALLNGSDDMLGPVVAYPEPGRGGATPPPHGGFAVLRGTPVAFRRVPSGTDALNRPGNYTVQVLMGHGMEVDAGLAAGLLASGWLESPLPEPTGQQLPLLDLPRPGPRRGSAASAAVGGAVLQGLRDQRRIVLTVPSEAAGRLALCDAVRRLPDEVSGRLTFSTLESTPGRSSFDIAVAVPGWLANGSAGDAAAGAALRVSATGDGLDARSLGWGEALANTSSAALRGIPEPVTAAAVGVRLEALRKLGSDPRRLTPEELLSVLPSPDGQAWAADPGAVPVARRIMSGMDPQLAPRFAKSAARRPAVKALLAQVGWESLSNGSRPPAEALLRELGESQSAIDLAVLAGNPAERLSTADSARYLRLTDERGGDLGTDPVAEKLSWDQRLMAQHPQLWIESVLAGQFRGPRPTGDVIGRLRADRVGHAISSARQRGISDPVLAKRLWESLPAKQRDQVDFLRVVAGSDAGLGITCDRILAQRALPAGVRSELLGELWPRIVSGLELPGYLATELEPAGGVRLGTGLAILLAVVVVALIAAGVWVGASFLG